MRIANIRGFTAFSALLAFTALTSACSPAFAADEKTADPPAASWSEIQPSELRGLFGDLKKPSANSAAGAALTGHLEDVVVERDDTANPPFSITYQQAVTSTMPADQFRDLCEKFRNECFGELEVTGFANKRLNAELRKDWDTATFGSKFMKSSGKTGGGGPRLSSGGWDPFKVPAGLSTPVDELLKRAGLASSPATATIPFPFTPATCTELAAICFRLGLYADGRAIAQHVLAEFPLDGRLLFIRGCCELGLEDKDACIKTLITLHEAWGGQLYLKTVDDINGPIAVRFLLAYLSIENGVTVL